MVSVDIMCVCVCVCVCGGGGLNISAIKWQILAVTYGIICSLLQQDANMPIHNIQWTQSYM